MIEIKIPKAAWMKWVAILENSNETRVGVLDSYWVAATKERFSYGLLLYKDDVRLVIDNELEDDRITNASVTSHFGNLRLFQGASFRFQDHQVFVTIDEVVCQSFVFLCDEEVYKRVNFDKRATINKEEDGMYRVSVDCIPDAEVSLVLFQKTEEGSHSEIRSAVYDEYHDHWIVNIETADRDCDGRTSGNVEYTSKGIPVGHIDEPGSYEILVELDEIAQQTRDFEAEKAGY